MYSLKAYYNGKDFIPLEKAVIKPNQKVIITILDEYLNPDSIDEKPFKKYVGKPSPENYREISEALKETEKVERTFFILRAFE